MLDIFLAWTKIRVLEEIRVLENKNGGGIKTVYFLHGRQFRVFQMQPHALWAMQCASHISVADAKLSQ